MKLDEFNVGENPVQCGCCDYFSLAERGKCIVCAVCYWEDDYECVSDNDIYLDVKSDINDDLTLLEARENFKEYGAALQKWSDVVISDEERNTLKCVPRSV